MNPIKVMLVDDSAIVRQHLAKLLTAAGIEVIGAASDPLFAMQRMKQQWPDVLVLDVEMPPWTASPFSSRSWPSAPPRW